MTTKKYKVAYDAGHSASTYKKGGGKGIKYDGNKIFEEHTFNAHVVKFAKELAEFNGIEVVLTQPLFSETEVTLAERVNKAKILKVDLLMSFHADYSENKSATGHWPFYWHTHAESKRLAQIWDKHANNILGNNCRKIQESKPDTWTNFHMTREPVKYGIPAILIEHDFFSNRNSIDLLLSEDFQKKCAETAVRATCEFLGISFKMLDWSDKVTQYQPQVIKERIYAEWGILRYVDLNKGKPYDTPATDVRMLKLDKNKIRLKLVWAKGKKVSQLVKEYGADYGINFPFFWNGNPIADCKIGNNILNRGYDNPTGAKQTKWHGLKYKNGVLSIGRHDINEDVGEDGFITKTTPLLIDNGNLAWDYYQKNDGTATDIGRDSNGNLVRAQRTFIGLDKNGDIYLYVADGRTKYDRGLTLEEMALYAKAKNNIWALNGDGGGSSVIADKNGVLSQHEGSLERVVNHAILIFLDKDNQNVDPEPQKQPETPSGDWRVNLGTNAVNYLISIGILTKEDSQSHIDTLLVNDKWLMFVMMERLARKVVK